MNILVIGNGFDLAHGLPTKYTDFLFFCKVINCIIKDNEIEREIPKNVKSYTTWLNSCEEISLKNIKSIKDYIYNIPPKNYNSIERDKEVYKEILDNFIEKCFLGKDKDQNLIKEVLYLIFNNFWINYFLQCDMHGNENWIDFESEISDVVKHIDKKMRDEKCNLYDSAKLQRGHYMEQLFMEKYGSVTYKGIRDKLEGDLNKLICSFEIYLTEYVEKIDCKLVSPDIQRILPKEIIDMNGMSVYDTYVLSFNYTNTYQRLYIDKGHENKYFEKYMDYIHGKADSNNKIESNNMVLGIDEYLEENKQNTQVEFIAFKKFYQRIYKGTGCKYKEWIEEIRSRYFSSLKFENNCKRYLEYAMMRNDLEEAAKYLINGGKHTKERESNIHNLYIFGHSLDVTDKDILRELILNDNVHTTIFYHNKDVMGQQIANLVKVIGQDELIRRTGGSTKTIEFKQQQDMVSI